MRSFTMHPDRRRARLDAIVWLVASAFLVALLAAQADAAPAATPDGGAAAWREECGSCHIPFPARMLPPSAWSTVLDGLDRHYGVDASLPPATVRAIRAYLGTHAGATPGAAPATAAPRITTSAWFRREHDEVAPGTWKRAAVKSAANCGACHEGAAQGDFDEDGVRIPK
jgi:hypothetical protein